MGGSEYLLNVGYTVFAFTCVSLVIRFNYIQVAGTTLINLCNRIGPDLTALHVLPKLKELFDELAFSQEAADCSVSKVRKRNVGETQFESRIDLV